MTTSQPASPQRVVVILVAIACLVSITVWLGVRSSRSDADATGPSEQTAAATASESAGAEQIAPRSDRAPKDGVVLPDGAEQTDGYPVQFPYTDLGAVAVQASVVSSIIGFDYDQAIRIATLYAAPDDRADFEQRARHYVAEVRNQAGVPADGPVPAPASFAATPIAFTVEELETDYYAVNILTYYSLTTVAGKSDDYVQGSTQLVRWIDGDWKLVSGDDATARRLRREGQPTSVAPGTREFEKQGWILINGEHP